MISEYKKSEKCRVEKYLGDLDWRLWAHYPPWYKWSLWSFKKTLTSVVMLVKTREIYLKTKFYRPENPSVLCWIKTYHWQIRCDAVASSIWGGFWGFQFRISLITGTIAQPFFCCKKLIPCLCPQTLFLVPHIYLRGITAWRIGKSCQFKKFLLPRLYPAIEF